MGFGTPEGHIMQKHIDTIMRLADKHRPVLIFMAGVVVGVLLGQI